LFRISGSVEEMNRLRAALDAKEKVDFVKIDQPHVIAGLLKQFFRELPSAFLSEDFASTLGEFPIISQTLLTSHSSWCDPLHHLHHHRLFFF
jgi:hypothetical protein